MGLLYIVLVPYLGWLAWAAIRYPVPLIYNWRSLWQRKVSTLSTAGAIGVVVAAGVDAVPNPSGSDVRFGACLDRHVVSGENTR